MRFAVSCHENVPLSFVREVGEAPDGWREPTLDELHADKAYRLPAARPASRTRGILARIARRGMGSSARLGRRRWVVERTFAHLKKMRRLAVRYDRRADIYLAFFTLGCALLAFNHLARLC